MLRSGVFAILCGVSGVALCCAPSLIRCNINFETGRRVYLGATDSLIATIDAYGMNSAEEASNLVSSVRSEFGVLDGARVYVHSVYRVMERFCAVSMFDVAAEIYVHTWALHRNYKYISDFSSKMELDESLLDSDSDVACKKVEEYLRRVYARAQ